jgi:hypothetical protein
MLVLRRLQWRDSRNLPHPGNGKATGNSSAFFLSAIWSSRFFHCCFFRFFTTRNYGQRLASLAGNPVGNLTTLAICGRGHWQFNTSLLTANATHAFRLPLR